MLTSGAARLVAFDEIPVSVWDDTTLPLQNPMQSHEWLQAAAEAYCENGKAHALIVGPNERPDALAVLGKSKRWADGYKLLGTIDIGESVEVIHRDAQSLDALVQGFVNLGHPVDFGHYPTASGFPDRLRQAFGARGVVVSRPQEVRAAPSLTLDESWEDPDQRIGSHRRRAVRRKFRLAEKLGPVTYKMIVADPGDVDGLVDKFVEVEANSWKSKAGTSLSQNDVQAEFIRKYAHLTARKGILRFCFMYIGDAIAAAQFAVIWGNRIWAVKIGYDEQFRKFSPGELLMLEIVRYSVGLKLSAYEFCGKEAPWTNRWTDLAYDISALRAYPATPAGAVKLAQDVAQFGVKSLIKRLQKTTNK